MAGFLWGLARVELATTGRPRDGGSPEDVAMSLAVETIPPASKLLSSLWI